MAPATRPSLLIRFTLVMEFARVMQSVRQPVQDLESGAEESVVGDMGDADLFAVGVGDEWDDIDVEDCEEGERNADASALLPECKYVKDLGEGTTGSTFKVTRLEKEGALKIMSKVTSLKTTRNRLQANNAYAGRFKSFGRSECVDEETVEAFERECSVQSIAAEHGWAPRIQGKEIIKASADIAEKFKTHPSSNYGVILMDIANGEPLSDVIAGKTIEVAIDYMNLVARRIKQLHDSGIYHGDMGFDNIFIQGQNVTIIDYGKARYNETGKLPEEFSLEHVFRDHCLAVFVAQKLHQNLSKDNRLEASRKLVEASDAEVRCCTTLAKGIDSKSMVTL